MNPLVLPDQPQWLARANEAQRTCESRGRVVSRESTSSNRTTIYDASGRNVGRYTTSPQR